MKKLFIIAALLGVGYYAFGSKKTETISGTPIIQTEEEPFYNQKIGFNADGTVRELTDAEAELYLKYNIDLVYAFGSDLDKAKAHWFGTGYKENRPFS